MPSLLPHPTDCTDHVCRTRGRVTNEHQKVERRRGGHGDPHHHHKSRVILCVHSVTPQVLFTHFQNTVPTLSISLSSVAWANQTSIRSCLNCTLYGEFLCLLLLSSGSLLMEYPEEVCFVNIIHLSLWRFPSYVISPLE